MERARRCPMWLSATRAARADGRRDFRVSRAHRNVAIVAFANKLARIAWRCCGAENGSPSQECPWRHRTRPVALKASNAVNRGLREGNDGMA